MRLRILAVVFLALAVVTPAAARDCVQFGDVINCDDGSTIHVHGPFVSPGANWDEYPFFNGLANQTREEDDLASRRKRQRPIEQLAK
jgi:hypothetical protein